jgi:hypothetical protein
MSFVTPLRRFNCDLYGQEGTSKWQMDLQMLVDVSDITSPKPAAATSNWLFL